MNEDDFNNTLDRQLNKIVDMANGVKSLTDKEIADYLRKNDTHILDKIYRALYNNGGPINSSEMIPPPLPLRFMTRALTADVELIIINWDGGSDEGHLTVNLEDWNGKSLSL